MAETRTPLLPLSSHPDTPNGAVRRVGARVEAVGPDSLRFRYELEADLGRVRIPPPVADPQRADRLWAGTCFEAFVRAAGSPGYLELNFSPSGQWAAYRFESYRQGAAPAALESAPRLAVLGSSDRLELQAEVRLGGALSALAGAGLRIALTTVVEDMAGGLSYWALRHPPGRPDFHHPHGFSLELEFPRNPLS